MNTASKMCITAKSNRFQEPVHARIIVTRSGMIIVSILLKKAQDRELAPRNWQRSRF
jgi:hypothetical protein